MAICGVVASESLLTYDPVRSGGIPRSALHLTIPEQAPTSEYSDRFVEAFQVDVPLQPRGEPPRSLFRDGQMQGGRRPCARSVLART